MASDLLSTIRDEIDWRMKELRPLLVEYEQLLGAVGALVSSGYEDGAATAKTGPTARTPRKTRAGVGLRGSAAGAIGLAAAPPAKVEVDRKLNGNSLAQLQAADVRRATSSRRRSTKPKPERAMPGAAREAILGALEHGSHTVGELAVVTAMSGPNINGNLRRLALEGVVVRTGREGMTAWSLVESAV